MSHSQTLAYQPVQFFQLGANIATWCCDPEIFASFPVILEDEGRIYFYTSFGYCPLDSGVSALFAWDDKNEEFCFWDSQIEEYDFLLTPLENANNLNPTKTFSDLASLNHYIKTGEG